MPKASNTSLLIALCATLCLSACAGFNEAEFASAEAGLSSAQPDPSPATQRRFVRRSAAVGQAALLYAKSTQLEPAIRPVATVASLSSLATSSAGGFFRRLSIDSFSFPSLAATPIPAVTAGPGMNLDDWETELDAIVGRSSYNGRLSYLVDGEEYFSRLADAINSATDRIDIRTYIFDNDDFAVSVADLLKERSNEIDIRVLVDGLGEMQAQQADPASLPGDHRHPLSMPSYLERKSRVAVRTRNNPWFTGDHTKTTIVDRKIAFVGGMNIGREYRYDWHDLMIEVQGPVVARLQKDSDKAWAHASWLGDLAWLARAITPVGQQQDLDDGYPVRLLYTREFDPQIYRSQLAAIRRAQSYILIQNAYFSDDVMLFELAKARRRGVDVRVILPEEGNHPAMNRSNRVAINKMLEHGIRVYLYPGMSNVKAAIYDGWACMGSANFDKLSLQVNKELNLATSNPDAVNELLHRVFIPDLAVSQEIESPFELTFAHRLAEFAADEFL